MTQLDLPPISFARYLDLLKRRRWQVLPVSVLGLVIGAAVAFFVPRYYVAESDVRYSAENLITDPTTRNLNDPMRELLASANLLLPALVPDALQKLGWPEAMVEDRDAAAAFESAVRSEVRVNDLGPRYEGRINTNLRVSYRDKDGVRAAALVNTLVQLWIERQLADIRRGSDRELERLQLERTLLIDNIDAMVRERRAFELQHKLDPTAGNRDAQQLARSLSSESLDLERRSGELEREQARVESELETVRTRLVEGLVPARIPAKPEPVTDPVLAAKIAALVARIQQDTVALELSLAPGNEFYELYKNRLEANKAKLDELQPKPEATTEPNPRYVALEARRDELVNQLKAIDAERAPLERRVDEIAKRIAELPRLMEEYSTRLQRLREAQESLASAESRIREIESRQRQLVVSEPFRVLREARVPPRPTEPSITVLALAGSVLGLGLAIALILALDALRFTFKTIEDLERGLPIPVLGGVSHLETQDEIRQSRRGRIVMTAVFGTLLFLLVALVTIYYVAPARLPTAARDLLDMVLGAGD